MTKQTLLCIAVALVISACGGSGGGGGPDPDPAPAPDPLAAVFDADNDGDAAPTDDPSQLASALDATFGNEDASPIDVEPNDEIGEVIARARNGQR